MTSQVRNLWCRSQNKMGPSSKYVSSQHIVDLRQPQVAMKHHLRSVKNTCVAQSLYSEFRPLSTEGHNKVCKLTTIYMADSHESRTIGYTKFRKRSFQITLIILGYKVDILTISEKNCPTLSLIFLILVFLTDSPVTGRVPPTLMNRTLIS